MMKSLSNVDYFRKRGQELKKCEVGDTEFVSVQLCSFKILCHDRLDLDLLFNV